jgi:uncharacterized protein YcbK (DUF882 family)
MRGLRGACVLAVAAVVVWCVVADAQVRRPARAVPSRASRPTTPAGYYRIVRAWHTPSEGKAAPMLSGRPELVLHAMYIDETMEMPAQTDRGGFSAEDLDRAAHTLREPATGNAHPLEPRTMDMLYRIQTHFEAQEIRVMSAVRTPVPGNGQGLHGKGRAVDFVVPGASDMDVARFARELGFVGVGVYPIGSFVHVDVRERSYFWMDKSGPGHKSRERGILLDVAQRSDAAARTRGELPPDPFGIGADVDAALKASAAASADSADSDDDQEDEQ